MSAAKPDRKPGGKAGALLVLGGALGLLLAGCSAPEEVEHYQAPKSEPLALAAKESGPVRLVVAIVPHDQQTWFFKLTGPPPQVEEHRKEFDQLLASVHFTGKDEPALEWKPPADWKSDTEHKDRYITFHFGKDGALELAVTHFGLETGKVMLPNVNRWRGQVGLPPTTEDEVDKVVSETTVDGGKAKVVDLTGPGAAPGKQPPPFMKGHPPIAGGGGAASNGVPEYTTPPGWTKEERPATQFAVAEFTIGEGDHRAVLTVSLVGGDVSMNVGRWRTQVGLPPGDEEELRKDLRPIQVDGIASQYADLVGPEAAGGQRILGVIVPHGGQSWFFKMRGPADLVQGQKPAFEAFLKSVHFGAGPGEKHE